MVGNDLVDFDALSANRSLASNKVWEAVQTKERILRQNTRTLWLKEGWLEDVILIKDEIRSHFERRFSITSSSRPVLEGVDLACLSLEDSMGLEVPFLEEEMKDVIWNSEGDKSPGSDGFSMGFYKKCWPFFKKDIIDFVNEFFEWATLPKGVTASFLALISKVDNPSNLDDFRPICLIGSMYRILSKLLAQRLKKVISKLVSKCQSAFVARRNMLDGVLIVNETLDVTKREKKSYMMVKVDF
ncbi:uncharacterized protein LOC131658884 [Vicia villosa]|uniref:uncharacterized protein LOC131658884 n=1 Tax=Vicia villosa TaxID=3911 RepID=UPI00273B0275|nr:uncharacterized protein LOC131658884 [Vicia villosa]